jgi:hypothetical protein
LTGFFFDLVAIDRLVGKGARGLESDDFAPARMESVRPANLTDLLHNVNNLGLQTGHFGGWQAGLAEAGREGVAAGLELVATQGAEGVPGDGAGLGRGPVHEKGRQN